MYKNYILLLILIFFINVNFSQDRRVITTAVPFLMISADARASGLGEQGVATSPDAFSQHWNPSKYVFSDKLSGIGVSYTPYLSKLVNDGDFLRIAKVEGRSSNEISLKGAVKRPGKYAWYEGIKITDIIQGHDSDLSDDSDELKSIIVRRRDKASGNIDVYSFSLAEIISQPDSSDNLLLDQHDEIYIFTKNKIEDMEKEVRENQLNERLSQQLTLSGNALDNTLFSQYEFLGNSVEKELEKSLKPDILPSGNMIFENEKITNFTFGHKLSLFLRM